MYKISINVLAKSLFRLPIIRLQKKNTFVTKKKYHLSVQIKNTGDTTFPGGNFLVQIIWPSTYVVRWPFSIKSLIPDEDTEETFGITDVLCNNPALFLANGNDKNQNKIKLYDINGNKFSEQEAGFHIYTIVPINADELYQLWALLFTAFSTFFLFIKDVFIPFLNWLSMAN